MICFLFTKIVATEEREAIVAYFTMVARDKITGRAVEVHKIDPQTEREKQLFNLGEENKSKRMKTAEQSLMKRPPSDAENLLIHSIFLKMRNREKPKNFCHSAVDNLNISLEQNERPMNSSQMKTTRLMYPQQRTTRRI